MANITFSKKEFEKHIQLTEKNIEKISMFGTPISISGDEVSIEVFPNRPDLLSMHGFLRAIKAFLGKETVKDYKVQKSGLQLIVDKSVPEEWPYAIACIIKGLEFTDARIREVIDIQEKLAGTFLRKRKKGGIGLYPLQKIKFPVRFIGLPAEKIKFRPLEYPEEISGREILAKHPTGREYAHICQAWSKLPVFMDDKKEIMSMPPIINSHDLGKIGLDTKDIFLEATGRDLKTLQKAVIIIASALAEMGGKIYSLECVQKDGSRAAVPDLSQQKMKLDLNNANSLLGLGLQDRDLPKLLEKMGLDYSSGNARIPAWRADILHEVDIIEDLAIAYGYENFKPEIPKISTIAQESRESKMRRAISEILIGLGLIEISSYHLIKKSEMQAKDGLEVLDSKTEYSVLRPSLLTPALRTFAENKDNEYPQKIFEIGNVFYSGKNGILEPLHLLIAYSPGNFTEIKQALEYLARMLSLDFQIKESIKPELIEGRTGQILINNKQIGYIGEVHPETLRAFNLKLPASVLEISLESIFESLNQPK